MIYPRKFQSAIKAFPKRAPKASAKPITVTKTRKMPIAFILTPFLFSLTQTQTVFVYSLAEKLFFFRYSLVNSYLGAQQPNAGLITLQLESSRYALKVDTTINLGFLVLEYLVFSEKVGLLQTTITKISNRFSANLPHSMLIILCCAIMMKI